MILPLWLVPLHDLLVWSDPFGRFLLHRWEKIAALFTSVALLVALAFLAAWYRYGEEASAWLAAGCASFGTYGSLMRCVRSRAAAWRVGVGAALIAADLVGGWIAARRPGGDPELFALLYLMLMVWAFPTRRWTLALPSVTAGGRSRSGR
jgi:hypothetical protein